MFHEVRQPVQVFSLNLYSLQRHFKDLQVDDSSIHRIMDQLMLDMVQATKCMSTILNDVIDMEKVQEGKFTLDMRPFAFSRLLESSFRQHQTAMAENGIEFLLDMDPRLRRRVVKGDFERLTQVMI